METKLCPRCHGAGIVEVPTAQTIDAVIQQETELAGITRFDIEGANRTRAITKARHRVMARLRDDLGCSLKEIGLALGGRHYSTVIDGIRQGRCYLAASRTLVPA